MRQRILKWLFDSDLKDYYELLQENRKIREQHIKTLEDYSNTLDTFIKVLDICKEHNICVEEELEV